MDLGVLAQYGPLGVFAIVLVIFARGAHKREVERGDALAAEVARLNALLQSTQERVIPALVAATTAVDESQRLLRDMQRELDRRR